MRESLISDIIINSVLEDSSGNRLYTHVVGFLTFREIQRIKEHGFDVQPLGNSNYNQIIFTKNINEKKIQNKSV